MRIGAKESARRFKSSPEDVKQARRIARIALRNSTKSTDKSPKILVFDIETLPLLAFVWMTYKQHVGNAQKITKMHNVVTWVAKWLHNDEVIEAKLTPREIDNEDDSRIIKQLRDLFDEADILIGHNIDKFDIPIVNTRCLIAGIDPPSPFTTVDTLKVAKKSFRFPDNKLQSMSEGLSLDGKLHTDFDLWRGCMIGTAKSRKNYIQDMLTYNIQDVILQEEVYLEVLPWIKSHPNLALYVKGTERRCTNCNSTNLEKDGYYYTSLGKFKTYKCIECGAKAGRERKNLIDKETSKSLLMPQDR